MPKEIPKHQQNVKPALLNDTPAKKNTTPKDIGITSTIKNKEKKKRKKNQQ